MPTRIRIICFAGIVASIISASVCAQDSGKVLDLSSLFDAADLEGIADPVGSATAPNREQASIEDLDRREQKEAAPPASSGLPESVTSEEEAGEEVPEAAAPMSEAAVEPMKQPKPQSNGLITNSFYDTDLRQALQDIGMSVGRTIICTPDVSGFLTCELDNATFEEALRLLLAGTGYSSMEKDGYVLIYEASATAPNFLEISETKILFLNYVHPASAVNLLAPQLHEYISTDDAIKTNQLSITAPPNIMQRILDDLKQIDLPSKQVLLDVRIVIIEGQQLLNMGVTWEWPQISTGAYSNNGAGGWPWQVQIGYTPSSEFTNALNLTLDLLSQNDQATVLANPQVMSIDGEEAQIRVIREEYFEILTQGFYTSSQLEKVEAGTSLQITPRIGMNEEITMQITTEVSDVISRGANSLPVVTRRSSSSRVRVENGGTAAIAGLVDNRVNSANIQVPGFSSIPIVGSAFKDRRNQHSSRQVAIFVTPNIVPDRSSWEMPETDKSRPALSIAGEAFTDEIVRLLNQSNDHSEKADEE